MQKSLRSRVDRSLDITGFGVSVGTGGSGFNTLNDYKASIPKIEGTHIRALTQLPLTIPGNVSVAVTSNNFYPASALKQAQKLL